VLWDHRLLKEKGEVHFETTLEFMHCEDTGYRIEDSMEDIFCLVHFNIYSSLTYKNKRKFDIL
jgi:hypothetical protein